MNPAVHFTDRPRRAILRAMATVLGFSRKKTEVLVATGPGFYTEIITSKLNEQKDMLTTIVAAPLSLGRLSVQLDRTRAPVVIVGEDGLGTPANCATILVRHPGVVVLSVSEDERSITMYDRFPSATAPKVVERIRAMLQARLITVAADTATPITQE